MGLLNLKFVKGVSDIDYDVMEFHGEFDQSTFDDAEQRSNAFLSNFERRFLILDLTDLKFINREGIGFLVSMHTKLVKKGKNLLIFGAKHNVTDVFELVGLPQIISIFSSMNEAIKFIKKNY